jgi:hypothetical protein
MPTRRTLELGATDHFVPSHRSARTFVLAVLLPDSPTAMHEVGGTHDTDDSVDDADARPDVTVHDGVAAPAATSRFPIAERRTQG